jgi:hypothetical protein
MCPTRGPSAVERCPEETWASSHSVDLQSPDVALLADGHKRDLEDRTRRNSPRQQEQQLALIRRDVVRRQSGRSACPEHSIEYGVRQHQQVGDVAIDGSSLLFIHRSEFGVFDLHCPHRSLALFLIDDQRSRWVTTRKAATAEWPACCSSNPAGPAQRPTRPRPYRR